MSRSAKMTEKEMESLQPLKLYSIPLCHRMTDRTIYFRNKPLPLCARCTGTLIGVFTLPIFHWGIITPSMELLMILTAPALVDGTTQFIGWRKSNNILRLITGFFLGTAISLLIVFFGKILINLILNNKLF